MTVIFQLFCAEDLEKLGADGRQKLQEIISGVLDSPKSQGSVAPMREPIRLETSNNVTFAPSANVHGRNIRSAGLSVPSQIKDLIKQRFIDVSQRLHIPLPYDLPAQSDPDNYCPQQPAPNSPEEVLRWAISCEVNHVNFYYPLLLIKERAYKMFVDELRQRPRGPDSPYSPFNPLHPLYGILSDLQVESDG